MNTYEKIKILCNRKGFAISNIGNVVPDAKVTRGAVSGWKKGAVPSAATIKAIADYFHVSVDYLTDESIGIELDHNTINGNNNIIGNGNTVGQSLTSQEKVLLDLFRNMDEIQKAELLSYAAKTKK